MIVVPNCVVVVAPRGGRVRRLATEGAQVESGDPVAVIDSGGSQTAVPAPRSGRVRGALAVEDQALDEGEGVVWLTR